MLVNKIWCGKLRTKKLCLKMIRNGLYELINVERLKFHDIPFKLLTIIKWLSYTGLKALQYNPVSSMVCLIISSVFKVVHKVVQNLRRETNLFFKRGYSTGSIVRWRLIFLFFDTWWYKATAMKRNEGRMMMKSMWI